MKDYTVTAKVNHSKYGEGELVAKLDEEEIVEYAQLSDSEKLDYLKGKNAVFHVNAVEDLSDDDIESYQIQSTEKSQGNTLQGQPQVSRKMRVNINGRDSGWVDVTEENEAQYQQMMDEFERSRQEFNKRFENFFNFTPASLLSPFTSRKQLDEGNPEQ